jgi:hypothetical protein
MNQSTLILSPLSKLDLLLALLFIFRKAISSISSGHFIPKVSGQKLAAPKDTMAKMVNKMKWLIPSRVKAPITIGASVDATVPKTLRTPTDMFLTLVGYS